MCRFIAPWPDDRPPEIPPGSCYQQAVRPPEALILPRPGQARTGISARCRQHSWTDFQAGNAGGSPAAF